MKLTRFATFCVLALCAAVASPALAQCPVGSSPFTGTLGVDANLWELEGPLSAVDVNNRTITANGMTFQVPSALLIDTGLTTGLSMSCWADPTVAGCFASVPANPKSIVGGTVIALGTVDTTTNPGCLTYVADSVFFEFAENVIAGPLTSLNAPSDLTINGAAITMNTDPRMPANIIDGAGQSLTLADLQGLEGISIGAEGYYDATTGELQAILVELEEILVIGSDDVIGIDGVEWRGDKDELRVDGTVVPVGAMPASLSIYAPGVLDSTGAACSGTLVATTPVDAVGGSFEYRNRGGFANDPGSVCVASPNGGAASSPTTAN